MDPRAAAIRALVAERAADARVTAATSRRPRPLAVDAATFLAQEEQAAARRRRSQSGRRARPEPPHLVSWAEGVEAPPLSPPPLHRCLRRAPQWRRPPSSTPMAAVAARSRVGGRGGRGGNHTRKAGAANGAGRTGRTGARLPGAGGRWTKKGTHSRGSRGARCRRR